MKREREREKEREREEGGDFASLPRCNPEKKEKFAGLPLRLDGGTHRTDRTIPYRLIHTYIPKLAPPHLCLVSNSIFLSVQILLNIFAHIIIII